MNSTIRYLAEVAAKDVKTIIGLMSGTSLDGLDIALCEIAGAGYDTKVRLMEFTTINYPSEVAGKLASIASVEQVSLEEVCVINAWLGNYHADLVLEAMQQWEIEPSEVDCIASHGQTLYHAPSTLHQQKGMPDSTLQVGDGDHIARRTGILTISDFRQKHIAAGGEGAPLAGLVDELLFRDEANDRVLLNIGGIANFTYLPANRAKKWLTTDTGPGNTLINAAMQKYTGKPFDEDGHAASTGKVYPHLIRKLKSHPYFRQPVPKTTGPEEFNIGWVDEVQENTGTSDISPKDLVATLTRFSAETIADTIKNNIAEQEPEIYLSGGGMHNRQLVKWISDEMDGLTLQSFEEIGFDPDAKEAVCFGVLANETLSGNGFLISPKRHTERRVNLGKISLPV